MTVYNHAHVYFKDARSDKEYDITLSGDGLGFTVKVEFGPRGGTQTHVDLTRGKRVSYIAASALFNKKLQEKLNKGYSYNAPSVLIEQMKKETGVFLFAHDWKKIADFVTAYVEEQV